MLERIIGFLPIILLFAVPALIGLRRAARRRRLARAEALAAAQPPAETAKEGRGGTGTTAVGPGPREIARTAGDGGAGESAGAPLRGPAPAARRPVAQVREQYVYPPPLELKRLRDAAQGAAAGGEDAAAGGAERSAAWTAAGDWRMIVPEAPGTPRGGRRPPGPAPPEPEPRESRGAGDRVGESTGERIWRRLGALPPLQRAVAFSEILGPPRGLDSQDQYLSGGRGG